MKRKGYNLIEVLIAMALLAWVVLVISGLFIYGQRGVHSGKTQTKAVSIVQKIHEDLKNLSGENKYKIVNNAGAMSASANALWDQDNLPSLPTTVLQNTADGWMTALAQLSINAQLDLTVTATIARTAGTGPTLGNCLFFHYSVRIIWMEGPRRRTVPSDFSL